MSFQIVRVGGRRSSRAEISPIAMGALSAVEICADGLLSVSVADFILLLPEHLASTKASSTYLCLHSFYPAIITTECSTPSDGGGSGSALARNFLRSAACR